MEYEGILVIYAWDGAFYAYEFVQVRILVKNMHWRNQYSLIFSVTLNSTDPRHVGKRQSKQNASLSYVDCVIQQNQDDLTFNMFKRHF